MGDISSLLFLVLVFAAMYFLLIRPQQKRQKAVAEMQKTLATGTDVITIGGIHGTVAALTDEYVDLEVTSDGVVLRFKRNAIADVIADDDGGDDDE